MRELLLYKNKPIDLYNPINRDHPLNVGRSAWWISLPELFGGNVLYELINGIHAYGQNMNNSSSGYTNRGREGGYGSILTDGTSSYLQVINTPSYLRTVPISISVWMSMIDGNVNYPIGVSGASTDATRGWELDYSNVINQLGYQSGSLFYDHLGGSFLSANMNHFVLILGLNNANALYVNGIPIHSLSSDTAGLAGDGYGLIQDYAFGFQSYPSSVHRNGWTDDVSIWNRYLSADDVMELYMLGPMGYPGVLNRVGTDFGKLQQIIISSLLFRRTQFNRAGSRGES